MRRLRSSRDDRLEADGLEGFERTELEGDPVKLGPDAVVSLRPFGQDVPDQSLGSGHLGGTGAEEVRHRARALGTGGRRLEAIQLLRQHCADHPRDVEARVELASLLDQAGDPDGAAGLLSTALEVEPGSAELLVRRGALHARSGRVTDAERDFEEAIRLQPSHGVAYRYLGIARLRRGLPAEAADQLRLAIQRDPNDADATLHLGEALAALGQVQEALGILQRAGALCPDDPKSYLLRGRLLDRLGRTEEAMIMHRQAREVATA